MWVAKKACKKETEKRRLPNSSRLAIDEKWKIIKWFIGNIVSLGVENMFDIYSVCLKLLHKYAYDKSYLNIKSILYLWYARESMIEH